MNSVCIFHAETNKIVNLPLRQRSNFVGIFSESRETRLRSICVSSISSKTFRYNTSKPSHLSSPVARLNSGFMTRQTDVRLRRPSAERTQAVNTDTETQVEVEVEAAGISTKGDDSEDGGQMPWIPIGGLLSVYICNQWSRALIYYVNKFDITDTADVAGRYMNVDLGYGPQEYALLASFGFTALFAGASLLAGNLADNQDRRKLTVYACIAWSIITAGMGLATSFDELLVARALTGLAMSVTAPAAYSLISDLAPPSRLASASALYSAGIYFGGALASLGVLLDEQLGWRGTCVAVGLAGMLAAAGCWAVVRDPRAEKAKSITPTVVEVTPTSSTSSSAGGGQGADLRTSVGKVLAPVPVRYLLTATALRFCAGFGLAVWKAPFYLGRFPSLSAEFSLVNAVIVAGAGGASAVLGGRLADHLAQRAGDEGEAVARLQVPLWGSLLAAPLLAGALMSDTIEVSLTFMLLEYLAAECWVGPTVVSIYSGVPAEVKGTAQGIFSLLTAVGNVAPVVIGSLIASKGAESFLGVNLGDMSIGDAMIVVICSSYVLSAVFFGFASLALQPKKTLIH